MVIDVQFLVEKMLEHNAVFAGVFASLASVFSKLALEDDAKTLKFLFQDSLSKNCKISNYLLSIPY